ncbi:MAG: DEAD/DEAH box helicase [Nanoarchaeota archaeon]
MSFEELNVSPDIVKGLKEMGLVEPTKIQEKTIPLIKQGKDVIGISKTGSGKTAAFGVPILEKIKPGHGIQALIIAPVRELSVQIAKEMHKFGKHVDFRTANVYGGVSLNPQIEAMQDADIVIGTPGRLKDHLENYEMDLSKIKIVVLDEADKMVEMGFIEDIRSILDKTPKGRQMLLFGATISDEIEQIKRKYMNAPATVQAESHVQEDFLEQHYYNVPQHEKFSLLVHLLKKEKKGLTIIFCSARSTVEMVAKNLRSHGIFAEMIHGRLTQSRRLKVIESFHKRRFSVLVASAVAARGLDIKDVTHIFNYDLSRDPQEYVHRVGRTARAGEKGKAITLLSDKDHDVFREILYRYPFKVNEMPVEEFERLRFDARRSRERSGFGGGHRGHGDRGHSRGGFYRGSREGGERGERSDRPRESRFGESRPSRGPRPGGSQHGRFRGHSGGRKEGGFSRRQDN